MDHEEFLKKAQIVNYASTGFDLDVQMAGGYESITIGLHHMTGKKISHE